jgi:hypothetical protein
VCAHQAIRDDGNALIDIRDLLVVEDYPRWSCPSSILRMGQSGQGRSCSFKAADISAQLDTRDGPEHTRLGPDVSCNRFGRHR